MPPGVRNLQVEYLFHEGTQKAELTAKVDVRPLVLQKRSDFPVTHWWRLESLYEYYKVDMNSDRCRQLTRAYLKNLVDHGNNMIFVPAWFPRSEVVARPAQLLGIVETTPNNYEFDWTRVREFVEQARECGAEAFEWPHLWIYWGVKHPERFYTQKSDGSWQLLFEPDSDGFGDRYVGFLKQLMASWHRFLLDERILEISYFHLSDEPGGDEHFANYTRARQLLREIAPWMKVLDALSEVRYGKENLTDYPIPIISSAPDYIREGIPHWVYYCCGPRGAYVNRFMDTPLIKIRMTGWLFYRLKAQGFLHWGYNGWHVIEKDAIVDPFTQFDAGWYPGIPNGDPFVVYPGENGPIDSIRWEVFFESLQDFALLQTAGIDRDDALLDAIKSYADFPKSEDWLEEAIASVLSK